jgi:5S rRNA maturation endonuclease (ribonuclease M5)
MNKYKKHLLILSEDDAYKDIANGFFIKYPLVNKKIEESAGGWENLIHLFKNEYEEGIRKNQNRHVLLLLDLDNHSERLELIYNEYLSSDIREQVFVLCCKDESERLKKNLGHGTFETIGKKLAESCLNNTFTVQDNPWLCEELKHNQKELKRLAELLQTLQL